MSSNNEKPSANRLAIELGKKIGQSRQVCGSWIRGTHSPEKTINGMIGDVCLGLMVALSPPGRTYSLREISRVTGFSYERIRQIEEEALLKIKRLRQTKEVDRELRD